MMKATKFLKVLLSAVVVAMTIAACTQDGDYDSPNISLHEPDVDVNTNISTVKTMDNGGVYDFTTAVNDAINETYVLEGYVISNDEAGNYYKTVVIQDSPENPTAGIQIDIDDAALYDYYKPGQKVYIYLYGATDENGNLLPALGMENQNGALHIGYIDGNSVARIPATEYLYYIKRSTEVAEIVPTVVSLSDLSEDHINTLVQLDNMQLSGAEVGSPYANADDTYTVNRNLVSCEDQSTIILRNSGYSSFKSQLFPTGSGSIVAVYSVYNSDSQLFIRDTDDVSFDNARCPSGFYNPADAFTMDFFEDYEGETAGYDEFVNMEGWANISAVDGSTLYEVRSFSGNNYAQISAYNSGENTVDSWLVTPGVIVDGSATAPVLNFDTKDGYYTGAALTVYISTDFNGDLTSTTWTEITSDVTLSANNTSSYGANFINSGDYDLSAYAGQTIYVGFRYVGGNSGVTSTYQIDNVFIGESTSGGGTGGGGGTGAVFSDDFASGTLANWTAYSVAGAQAWYYTTYGNPNDSAAMSGYDSNSSSNVANEDWLISNAIDLTGFTSATFSFDNVRRYAGNAIEVYMSTDYAGGNPNTSGTWTQLSANLDTDTTSFNTWVNSGDIDVSAAAGGTLYVAFKYTSTTSASTTIEIDNVVVNAQ
ncbi:DUF5689 domain-containing protein [Neptunitalea lumnitzerae]|uniref:DUF5017 domain-containing protein n=1 Tax=Neptunitalea lumnitzerae TaxID=2965509 RepID=A0ABQ5MGP3_9FLAO|nr:DUF5689 domain-containing protein [Neptunitalea sp. Y10]GLB48476.1 hypothetical protein Y10_08440 [Neptunitalea sp. Y10]